LSSASRGGLSRSRKAKVAHEWLCELVFRPLAQLVVVAVAPVRVPPPFVAASAGATGVAAAVMLGRGHMVAAALLVQLKTVLDNADGQLARLTGRITVFGRYLDSELDLFVNAALFAAVGWASGRWLLAAAAFVGMTSVLSANYNAERLYRLERDNEFVGMPEATGRADGLLRRLYVAVYAPQDRLFEHFVDRRLRDAGPQARLAYHDRGTVAVLANLGMSTQLAVFGLCIGLGHPLAFAWLALAELGLLAVLALRRELLVRTVPNLKEEAT
jgi:phosphatidylglycerophosphate synthase